MFLQIRTQNSLLSVTLLAAIGLFGPARESFAQPPLEGPRKSSAGAESLPPGRPKPNAGAAKPLLPEDRPIGSITANIRPKSAQLPPNLAAGKFEETQSPFDCRPWGGMVYYWDAPAFCYRPLYFEDVNLERHGYSLCPALQPAVSFTHFVGSTVALPYNMTVHPTRECIYPLGHYRPGSPAPYQLHRPELQMKAGVVEAGLITGLIFLIP